MRRRGLSSRMRWLIRVYTSGYPPLPIVLDKKARADLLRERPATRKP